VGVEPGNDAALLTYAAAGADEREDFVMLTWQHGPTGEDRDTTTSE